MKNAFCLALKTLFVLEIFTFLSWLFGYVQKRLHKRAKVNLEYHNFKYLLFWCVNFVKTNSLCKNSGKLSETLRKLFVFTEFLQ